MSSHVITVSNRRHSLLDAQPGQTVEDALAHRLSLTDGQRRFATSLWALPEGVEFDDVDLDRYPQEYIQAAGAFDAQMVCEIREGGRLFVLGRADGDGASEPVVIPYAEHEQTVRSDQALTGDEVVACFLSYLHAGREPDGFTRTEVQVS